MKLAIISTCQLLKFNPVVIIPHETYQLKSEKTISKLGREFLLGTYSVIGFPILMGISFSVIVFVALCTTNYFIVTKTY